MIAFMVALSHQEISIFENHLRDYIDTSANYVIGLETAKDSHQDTSGQHYHVCVDMEEKQYDAFRKHILVNKYKLAGQAKLGHPRQYGRIRKLRDYTKMLCYTVKDTNVVFRGYSLETIQELIEKSYPRPERLDIVGEILKELVLIHAIQFMDDDDPFSTSYFSSRKLEEKIIEIYLGKKFDKLITKSFVRHLVIKFMTANLGNTNLIGTDDIYRYVMK